MPFIFRPPTRMLDGDRIPAVPNPRTDFDDGRAGFPLMRHIVRPGKPVTVLVTNGVVTEHVVPTVDQTRAATYVYLGGHENVVSEAEKTVLEDAGYTVVTV